MNIQTTPASFTNVNSGPTHIGAVSRQWASRAPDERFLSLVELRDKLASRSENARAQVISSRKLTALPVEGDLRGLQIVNDESGEVLTPTNWSFTQACQRVGAPAAYLGKLPSPLAAACVNVGLQTRDVDDVKIYQRGTELAALTGTNYGRVMDVDLVQWAINTFGDGRTGDFRVPGEFGGDFNDVPAERQRHQTTIYGADRNIFVFLADEKNRVDIPTRRDGKTGGLARGIMFWNSEVGSDTIGCAHMLFDFACMNRNIWGVEGFREYKFRHTASAPSKWLEEAQPHLEAIAFSGAQQFAQIEATVKAAQATRVDDVNKFLSRQFDPNQVKAMIAAFKSDEGERPIETVWDANTAATAFARNLKYQDTRMEVERKAGKLLDLVAA